MEKQGPGHSAERLNELAQAFESFWATHSVLKRHRWCRRVLKELSINPPASWTLETMPLVVGE